MKRQREFLLVKEPAAKAAKKSSLAGSLVVSRGPARNMAMHGNYHVAKTERKSMDVQNDTLAMPFGSSTFTGPTLLSHAVHGTLGINHVGRRITMKSLYIRWAAYLNSTSGFSGQIRILVVYDRQCNGAAPAAVDVLLSNNFFSCNRISNSDRFIVLVDELTPTISVNDATSCAGVIYKKLNLECIFTDTDNDDVTDIKTGSIHIFAAQTGTITTAGPSVQYTSRIRFVDA